MPPASPLLASLPAAPLPGGRPPLAPEDDVGKPFELVSEFEPAGDQPQAIAELLAGIRQNERDQVLLGVTGSGKTFTMAQRHPGRCSGRR